MEIGNKTKQPIILPSAVLHWRYNQPGSCLQSESSHLTPQLSTRLEYWMPLLSQGNQQAASLLFPQPHELREVVVTWAGPAAPACSRAWTGRRSRRRRPTGWRTQILYRMKLHCRQLYFYCDLQKIIYNCANTWKTTLLNTKYTLESFSKWSKLT